MSKVVLMILAAASLTLLAACGEKPQTASGRKSDAQAWSGARDGFVAPGWKAGDKTSWDEQMRARGQNQNEYSRAPAAGK
ncbi:MAG: hypothetical protein RIQ60_623 [Pseudomonadota bacterium]|jgi:hypothetical protein